jgi:hypothetical protein
MISWRQLNTTDEESWHSSKHPPGGVDTQVLIHGRSAMRNGHQFKRNVELGDRLCRILDV